MRVVQIEPGPMPTLTPSAPASINALVASPVATLPASTCTRCDNFLMRSTVSPTPLLWPFAVSTTIRSHSASSSSSARYRKRVVYGKRVSVRVYLGGRRFFTTYFFFFFFFFFLFFFLFFLFFFFFFFFFYFLFFF